MVWFPQVFPVYSDFNFSVLWVARMVIFLLQCNRTSAKRIHMLVLNKIKNSKSCVLLTVLKSYRSAQWYCEIVSVRHYCCVYNPLLECVPLVGMCLTGGWQFLLSLCKAMFWFTCCQVEKTVDIWDHHAVCMCSCQCDPHVNFRLRWRIFTKFVEVYDIGGHLGIV